MCSGGGRDGGRAPWQSALAVLAVLNCISCHDASRETEPPGALAVRPTDPGPDSSRSASDFYQRDISRGLVTTILDPRMESLLHAAATWRRSQGPHRSVVDQVCLVPDLSTFLEAIATWDESSYFPILIDDPAWTYPFLRAFRPARVVHYRLSRPTEPRPPALAESSAASDRRRLWLAAQRAVALAWTSDSLEKTDLPRADRLPGRLGETPPGLVFSNGESPMLAAAVALAAGRFEPLVELEPMGISTASEASIDPAGLKHFQVVLSLAQARAFARMVQGRAEAVVGRCDRLGDRCDFLTLAGDWPYSYLNDAEGGKIRGQQALDDLVGHVLETEEGGLSESRFRWAFTGRIVGDPAASVYRAMCALFLQPDASFLWDTYSSGPGWSNYGMTEAAQSLGRLWPRVPPPIHRAETDANLLAWHSVLDPVSRFGWFMINSSGFPRQFSIAGGTGHPADLPRGTPAAVSIIHSFSAADPLDPSTIAGRWLEHGAYVYYGAMNEPFLRSFRSPKLIAELAATEIPLSAALRQGEQEAFGRPWRLVYLGDPLFAFRPLSFQSRETRLAARTRNLAARPDRWHVIELEHAEQEPMNPPTGETAQLDWCRTAAIAALCHPREQGAKEDPARKSRSATPAWHSVLASIDRQALEPALRPALDELVSDTLLSSGEEDRLFVWLMRIKPGESTSRVWQTIETVAMSRLMRQLGERSLPRALEVWDEVMRLPWPADSPFPAQFTRRLAGLVNSDPGQFMETYRNRLSQTAAFLAADSTLHPQIAVVNEELQRLERPMSSTQGHP
jgi:hypothetical protein